VVEVALFTGFPKMRMWRVISGVLVLSTMVAVAIAQSVLGTGQGAAGGTTFVVNTTSDADDGTCDAAHCSLREAINAANVTVGLDTIAFNISGAGPHTIEPSTDLPTVTDAVIIDGYTQPGASPNTNPPDQGTNAVWMIELVDSGQSAACCYYGLSITGGSSTVRGLVIRDLYILGPAGSEGTALRLTNNGGNIVEGNFLTQNHKNGVWVESPDNLVGGTGPAARNVIDNSFGAYVFIEGASATGNVVQGNLLGTDPSGSVAVGGGEGVRIADAAGNSVGGTTPAARNVISGADSDVVLHGSATNNVIQGNFLGTDVSGATGLGVDRGVLFQFGASGNTVGGTAAGAGNLIAYHTACSNPSFSCGNGIRGAAGTGSTKNVILGNSIFGNEEIGIDLFPGGVTPNDAGDTDGVQNFPELTLAATGSILVEGTLNSTPNTQFRIEFFSNSACDASGYGEGQTFIGAKDVTTDGSGNINFSALFGTSVPAGSFITATATGPDNGTSEFSQCIAAVDAATPLPTATPCPSGKVPSGPACGTPTPTPTDTPTLTPTPTPCPTGKVPAGDECGTATPTTTPCPTEKVPSAGGCGTPTPTPTATDTPTATQTPFPPDFSINVDPDEMAGNGVLCSTAAEGSPICEVSSAEPFTVNALLDALGPTFASGYTTVAIRLDYTGGLFRQDRLSFSEIVGIWPECGLPIEKPTEGSYLIACIAGLGSQSVYVGVVAQVDFTCAGSQTMEIVRLNHGVPDDTLLAKDGNAAADADPDEELTIHCSSVWDVNGDGSVSVGDIFAVVMAFGQTVPPASSNVDINADGSISIADIVAVVTHFGETFP
jgi:CSLREA domain-containing protein